MNTLIIFDLDGTLADTRADLAHAVNLTRKTYELAELTPKEIVNYVGGGRKNLIEQAFHDSPNVDIEEVCDSWSNFYSENLIINTCLYDGVIEGIQSLHNEGYYLAVCSNKPGPMCRRITAHFELDQYLVATLGGGDASTMKPEPEVIFEVMKKAEVAGFKRENDNVWMIGDHHTDLKVAENAKIKSIFCNYGFGKRAGLKSDFEVNSFDEIANLIS